MSNSRSGNETGRLGWLNNTVNVGNSDLSLATIIAIVLGGSFAFGTSWFSGIFSNIGLSVLITLVALYMAWTMRHEGLIGALMTCVTAFAVFRIMLWFGTAYLPKTILENDTSNWNEVRGEFVKAGPFNAPRGESVTLSDPLSELLESADEPTYSTIGGSPPIVNDVPDENIEIAPVGVPTEPITVPTADPLTPLLYDLNTAVANWDKPAALTVSEAILRIDPQNTRANGVLQQIDRAERIAEARQALPIDSSTTIDPQQEALVREALAGGTYQVTSIIKNTPFGALLACRKLATIKEMSGWNSGAEYSVQWCLLSQFNVRSTGVTFTVGGS